MVALSNVELIPVAWDVASPLAKRYRGSQLSYYGSIVHGCLEATLP